MYLFKINGVDFSDCISKYGFSETVEKVQGKNAGETLNGTLIEDTVAYRTIVNLTCNPLTSQRMAQLINALKPDYISVEYQSAIDNSNVTKAMISRIGTTRIALNKQSGSYYDALTIQLTERGG